MRACRDPAGARAVRARPLFEPLAYDPNVVGDGGARSGVRLSPAFAAGIAVAAAAVGAQIGLDRGEIAREGGSSLFDWVAVAVTATAGLAAAMLAVRRRGPLEAAVALGIGLLALADALTLRSRAPGWTLVSLVVLAAIALGLWLVARRSPTARALVALGLALLALSVALRVLYAPPFGEPPGWTDDARADSFGNLAKEAAQLAGWILVAWGLLTELTAERARARRRDDAARARLGF